MDEKKIYKPFKSSAKNKKYSVYVMKNNKKKLIHFGDSRYGQFKDKLGEYSNLDSLDKQKKKIIMLGMDKQMIKILPNIGVIKYCGKIYHNYNIP